MISFIFSHELFCITSATILAGFIGLFESTHFLNILLNFEIIFLGLNFQLITISIFLNDPFGHIFALCILALVVSGAVIGLSLVVLQFRTKQSIVFTEISTLKG